jgi:hypothetical protein
MEVSTQGEIAETKIASLDIEDLCRACACYSIDSILIFSEEGHKLDLQRKIQQYLNITVSKRNFRDILPCYTLIFVVIWLLT